MRVLLVGAGAVGQVYGHALHCAGADVAFLVKPQYADACRAGLTLYPLRGRGTRTPIRFAGFDVLTSMDEVRAQHFEQVWVCVSSTAARAGLLDDLAGAIGDATLVSLQPGIQEAAYVLERVPAAQVVFGAIAFISYQAPLPGEQVPEPGVAYWFPPGQPSPFSGPPERVEPIVAGLRGGGCPARQVRDAARFAASPSAMMMPLLTALELEGWSFGALRRGRRLADGAAAAREALAVVSAHGGHGTRLLRLIMRPLVVRAVLAVARRVAPLDLEVYLRYHFTKVADQTRFMMAAYIEHGQRLGVPTPALEGLQRAIGPG